MARFAKLPEGKSVPEHEHYVTPDAFAEWPVRHLMPHGPYHVLDAGAGSGPYGRALEKYGNTDSKLWGLDIRDIPNPGSYDFWINNTDYLTWASIKHYDVIIGNPPFSIAEQWIRRSMDLLNPGGRLILLLPINFLGSQKRLQLWRDFRPLCIVTCANRPSFFGSGTGDTVYMYIVWDKGVNRMTTWSAALLK